MSMSILCKRKKKTSKAELLISHLISYGGGGGGSFNFSFSPRYSSWGSPCIIISFLQIRFQLFSPAIITVFKGNRQYMSREPSTCISGLRSEYLRPDQSSRGGEEQRKEGILARKARISANLISRSCAGCEVRAVVGGLWVRVTSRIVTRGQK